MEQGGAFIRLRLSVRDQPIELTEFVSAFTALAAEYERFKRDTHPELQSEATLYVKDIRKGSIEADIISVVSQVLPAALLYMENVNTVTGFVDFYGKQLMALVTPGARVKNAGKSELTHFHDQVAAIAAIPNSTIEIASYEKIDGDFQERALFKFNTNQAQEIQFNTLSQLKEIGAKDYEGRERVTMVFSRTDTQDSRPGKKSGDLVVIEAISNRRLGLIYGSDLAEQAIKNEIREATDNVYKKAFVVDVFVETLNGKPFAYRVTHLHQVIPLEFEDEIGVNEEPLMLLYDVDDEESEKPQLENPEEH